MDDTCTSVDCTEDSEENDYELTRNTFGSHLCAKENFSGADNIEDSEENNLEITRNPFNSHLCERENFPGLDTSMFVRTTTPNKSLVSNPEFRWSIGQISLLNPADLELYPNQEYSISYDRKEDELRDQEEVNKYFQNVLLPSPWLDEKNQGLKRVTFSPHPPSMRYIHDSHQNLDSTHSSISPSNNVSMEAEKGAMLSDACCQTKITIPPNFDLEALLGEQFCTYEEVVEGKDLTSSTLRRKLFVQEVSSSVNDILMKSKTTCVASSPRKVGTSMSPITSSTSILDSPPLIISPAYHKSSLGSSVFNSSTELSPKHGSNINTPCLLHNMDMSLSPLTVSPIKSSKKKVKDYSFMPDVSFDDGSDCVKESSPVIGSVSPIENERKRFRSLESGETSNFSVIESTARYPHAFSGFDMSSINANASKGTSTEGSERNIYIKNDDIFESKESGNTETSDDDGPLDITELTGNELEDDSNKDECNFTKNNNSRDEFDNSLLNIGDITSINEPISTVINTCISSTSYSNTDGFQSNKDPNTEALRSSVQCSPLKGILKKRETLTPRKPLHESTTHFNTICNSGKKRPIPSLSYATDAVSSGASKPPLINRSLEFDDYSCSDHVSTSLNARIEHTDLVQLRANSVLRRASYVANRMEKELVVKNDLFDLDGHQFDIGKENLLNESDGSVNIAVSTAYVHISDSSLQTKKVLRNDFDSGISSMDWSGEKETLNKMKRSSLSTTPLMNLENLDLNASSRKSPWSKQNISTHYGKYSNLSWRNGLTRSHPWRDRSRSNSPILTPKSIPPRSHVLSRNYRNDISAVKRRQSDHSHSQSVFDAYKKMLPSPLR